MCNMRSAQEVSTSAKIKPKWYQSVIDDLEVAIVSVNAMRESLTMASGRQAKDFYTNANLHLKVNKALECKETIAKLSSENAKFAKMKDSNEEQLKKQLTDFFLQKAELEIERDQLINSLLEWKKRTKDELAEVRSQFKKLSNAAFCTKYGHIADLVINTKGVAEDIKLKSLPQIPVAAELRKKSNSELKVLADLTADKVIATQAANLINKFNGNESAYDFFFKISPAWLQVVDAEDLKKLEAQAKALAKEYFLAAEELDKHSKEIFAAINKQEVSVIASVKEKFNIITCRLKGFSSFFDKIKDVKHPQSQDLRVAIEKFAEIEATSTELKRFISEIQAKNSLLIKDYKYAGENFGVYRRASLQQFQKDIESCLTCISDLLTQVDSLIINAGNKIEAYKVRLAKESLLTLLEVAIEENLEFWHAQISSIWGSYAKVDGKISVPTGIANMVECLREARKENKSVDQKLLDLRDAAALRTQARPAFFAKRAENTTGSFYETLNFDLSYFSEHNLQQIQASLEAIKDVSGLKLDLRKAR